MIRPVSPEVLVKELAGRIARADLTRVAIDGPPAAEPENLADALVDPLRVHGRPAVRISTADFLRPASVRLEFGRHDPDSFYDGWVDEQGLRREVLDPAGPGGSGRIITRLWDAATDRAAREPYITVPSAAVVIVSGGLLLGGGLPFDFTVHLDVSAAALARRIPDELAWTIPAYARYRDEVQPASFADVVVRFDDLKHPAVVE